MIAYLLCQKGKPVAKAVVACTLWPEVSATCARDSLYKICRYIKKLSLSGIPIPIISSHGYLRLDHNNIDCDIHRFEQLYEQRHDIKSCREAVDIYAGPLLFDEYYEWTTEYDAFYEIRYFELLDILIRYGKESGNVRLEKYYRSKLNF